MSIKAIIFDVGGVLHSTENIVGDIVATLGITEEKFQKESKELTLLYSLGKITEGEYWQRFIEATNAPNPVPTYSLWGKEFDKKYRIHTDVLEVVHTLKQQGFALAILSNTNESHAAINRKHGIYDPFETIILSHEVSLLKPDTAIYQLTLEKMGTEPAESVFIDDIQENVDAAKRLGIHGIRFQGAENLIFELKKIGIIV